MFSRICLFFQGVYKIVSWKRRGQYISPGNLLCLDTQSCLTLCDPRDHRLPGSSVHGDSPHKNTGVGCRAFLQGFFTIQGSNPGLPHCRQILYQLSHQGSPTISKLVKNLPANVGDTGLISGLGGFHMPQGTTTTEPTCCRAHAPQQEKSAMGHPCSTAREQPLLTAARSSLLVTVKTQHSQKLVVVQLLNHVRPFATP